MSQWSLEFKTKSDNDLARLDNVTRKRIIEKLETEFTKENKILFPILYKEGRGEVK